MTSLFRRNVTKKDLSCFRHFSLLIFIAFSAVSFVPNVTFEKVFESQYCVQIEEQTIGNTIVFTCKDSKNRIVFSDEKHYAIMIQYLNNQNEVVLEKYFDSCGEPIQQPNGSFGVRMLYDESGRKFSVSYIDENDFLLVTNMGYSTIKRLFYDTGRIYQEYYYDLNNNPVSTISGEYGVEYQYDDQGRVKYISFLDQNGMHIKNEKGFCTIKRSYNDEGTIDKDMYYDELGNQISLNKGQYGIKHSTTKTLYLNKNGNLMVNLETIFYIMPYLAILIGTVLCILFAAKPKHNLLLLLLCLFL